MTICSVNRSGTPGCAIRAGLPHNRRPRLCCPHTCAHRTAVVGNRTARVLVSPRAGRAGMASPHTIERQRGFKEAGPRLGALREKWPLAFPVWVQDVRPLALGTVGQIAEAMGWSVPYTIGVLTYWKMAPFYCQAVLSHDQRITLDGAPAEPATPRRRSWRPGSWRNLRHVAPRSRPRPPRQNRSRSRPRQTRSQRSCVIGCVQACWAGARRGPISRSPK